MAEFAQMKTLILTSELGSLAAVARKLGLSSAAVSKQLTRLEEELGLQLLIRSTRRIELTDVGINYCLQCRRVLEEVEGATALISNAKATPRGVLKVVSGRHFANSYIIPHLKEFLDRYPQIELILELAERIPDLYMENIDVMMGMSISASGDVIQKRISTTSYVLCASPQYLNQFGTPKKPEDLKNHRYITHSMRQPNDELLFSNNQKVSLHPYLQVNDADTMLYFALEGMGIIRLHRYVVKDQLEQGKLLQLLSAFKEPEIPLYVAYPQRRFISSKVRCFVDFVIENMQKRFN